MAVARTRALTTADRCAASATSYQHMETLFFICKSIFFLYTAERSDSCNVHNRSRVSTTADRCAASALATIYQLTHALFFICRSIFFLYIAERSDSCTVHNGGCSHSCVDYGGQVRCQCPPGYELSTDARTCIGKHFFLFRSNSSKLRYADSKLRENI